MQPTLSHMSIANTRLLGTVREAVLPPLLDAFADVFDGLREPLLLQADAMEQDRAAFIDALFNLRQRRDAVLGGYRNHLVRAWQSLESELDPDHDLAPAPVPLPVELGDDLNLIRNDELEVQLAVQHLADVLVREWKSELLSLNGYLGWIEPGLRLDSDDNPFSPLQIAMAVAAGFREVAMPGLVRVAAVRACERDFVELVGPIYQSVHGSLMQQFGVPDQLTVRTRRASSIPSSSESAEESEPDWLSRFFVRWGDGVADAPEAPTAQETETSTLPPELHALLRESRAIRERASGRVVSAGPRTTLSQRELISILTLMQIASDEDIAAMVADSQKLLERLKRQMLKTAAMLGIESEAVNLDPADENVVDLIGMLFREIFEECDLHGAQRNTLAKLIAPLSKVALQDRQLFLQSSHPARRLLNVLAEASEGNAGETEDERALLDMVQATVERLVRDFNESQQVFRSLRGQFNAYYAQYRNAAELAEGKAAELQRREDAQEAGMAWAREVLLQKLSQRTIPELVRGVLLRDWVPFAASLHAAGRPQAPLTQLEGLWQSLSQSTRGADSSAVRSREAVADWLQPVWMSTGMDLPAIDRQRTDVLKALNEPPKPLRVVEKPDVEPVVAEVEVPDSMEGGADEITEGYFNELPVGSWLDFIDKDNNVQPGKLSWISPISARRLFVSRAGIRICVASPHELALMVKLERVRLHRDEDAFYSAMQGVIDQLDPAAAA